MFAYPVDVNKLDLNVQSQTPMIVGGVGPILYNEYDPDQMWFDFMIGSMMFLSSPPEKPKVAKLPKERTHAFCPQSCRRIYVYDGDEPQIVLPFHEFRRVPNSELKKLSDAGYPGWDRNAKGEVLMVTFQPNRQHEVAEWCHETCIGRYIAKRTYAIFQFEEEALHAKLRFG